MLLAARIRDGIDVSVGPREALSFMKENLEEALE